MRGAGTGLGREMALALADSGCDIVAIGRRQEPIESVGAEIESRGRRFLGISDGDVTKSERVNEMFTHSTYHPLGQVVGFDIR